LAENKSWILIMPIGVSIYLFLIKRDKVDSPMKQPQALIKGLEYLLPLTQKQLALELDIGDADFRYPIRFICSQRVSNQLT
jgi:hypothetical protein